MRAQQDPTPLHAIKVMLTALGVLFLGVSVFAYAWGSQSPWAIQAPGDDVPSGLLRQLRQEGMDCQPRPGRAEMFDCAYRQPAPPSDGQTVRFTDAQATVVTLR